MYVKPKLTSIEADALMRLLDKVLSHPDEPDKHALTRARDKIAALQVRDWRKWTY